jgi:hypothetical protein
LTERGTQIAQSDEQSENAPAEIHASSEPDSNVTIERDRHPAKHFSHNSLTAAGTQNDESDEHFENEK